MIFKIVLFYSIHLYSVDSHLQINLHLTDWLWEDENLQHDCLRVPTYSQNESAPYQIISYCMSELSSKFIIKDNNMDQKFTFNQLAKQNITSEQLYSWSTPIDIIEKYQFYLNKIKNFKEILMDEVIFYNCTLPYFGPKCQYVLNDHKFSHTSLDEIIHDYYRYNRYEPTLFTCYIHLECNRGPYPSCLDWTEICDGEIDCINDGIDEEHCWQLEIHQCDDHEYQCSNGQCISMRFLHDDPDTPDCLDKSDTSQEQTDEIYTAEPTFRLEDVICRKSRIGKKVYFFNPVFLTSSCVVERQYLLSKMIFSIKPYSMSHECWTVLKSMIRMSNPRDPMDLIVYDNSIIKPIINETCPDQIQIPALPILFGHIYLINEKKNILNQQTLQYIPDYVCYNNQRLHTDNNDTTFILFNSTCRYYSSSIRRYIQKPIDWMNKYILPLYFWLENSTVSISEKSQLVNNSKLYKCINWPKYISYRRILDGILDCYYTDDEHFLLSNETCSKENPKYFKCVTTNECIPKHFVEDQRCDCQMYDQDYCEDEDLSIFNIQNTVTFQTICDGFIHLSSKFIEKENETDETNCEYWPHIHIYNHCDGFWHNSDGSDEINCQLSSFIDCPLNNFICISSQTYQIMCLPIKKVNDGFIDCLGAADESNKCRMYLHNNYPLTFYCNRTDDFKCLEPEYICDGLRDCLNNEDELACTNDAISRSYGICTENYELYGSNNAKILCRHFTQTGVRWQIYFTLDQRQSLLERYKEYDNNVTDILTQSSKNQSIEYYQQRCHRGLDVQVWLDKEKNIKTNVCFCPPSYYGDQCQYQNQRVSLTLQFRVTSDSVKIPFLIVISLIDNTNEHIIHSSEQITYVPMKNCTRKYNIYLLYSTKPKDDTKEYFIHIDIYETITLNYRGSIIKTLNFLFLPIQRVAFQVNIPRIIDINNITCSNNECVHGKCITYYNDPYNRTFCQCDKGWIGQYCTIEYNCTCSSNSLCLGKLANNRSLCVCPLNKSGPQCLIDDHICQKNKTVTCYNNGQCIPIDEYGISANKFVCVCPKGYTGNNCELNGTQLILSIDKTINLLSPIFIHFIQVKSGAAPIRTTTFKTIPFGQDSILIYWLLPFHLVFIESNKTYYLFHMQKIYNQSIIITKTLKASDQCLHIKDLFNETMLNLSFIRLIKYYHLPCQTYSPQLTCFYDEKYLCLCQELNQQRVANCLEFDHNMTFDCSGQSDCLHEGKCYQENTICPSISVCQCPPCYYGSRCQFTTTGYSLSLDAILGYHIQKNRSISRQPIAVLISLLITMIITILGFSDGLLSLITFKNKVTHQTGCGLYLLCSSIITLIGIIIFLLKFIILLLTQIGFIENFLFLKIQYYSIDFILRFTLTTHPWLTTFVAIERAIIIKKGVNYNKKSKLIAKRTIIILVLLAILLNVHDPIYRRLIKENNSNDEDEKISCIVEYTSNIQIYNSFINIFNVTVPFIINIISAIIIIILTTRQKKAIQKKQKSKQILNEQIQQHKNLLIGPCVLIILAIPRLIISFVSGCMKSSKDSWLFLLGYFISLIPLLLNFILFVLPSTTYKQAFDKAMSRFRNMIRRRS